jgi:hypothetical protein
VCVQAFSEGIVSAGAMPHSVEGADLPTAKRAAVKTRYVHGGRRPPARQFETCGGRHRRRGIVGAAITAAADVPPIASMTCEAVSRFAELGALRITMQTKIVHAALTLQQFSPREWKGVGDFETNKPMVSKKESPESVAAVSRRLRLTRLAFDMNQATWSRFVGISPSAWSGVEGTQHKPASNRISLDQALLVCKKTGVGLDWIYRGERDDMPVKVSVALQKIESEAMEDLPPKRKTAS